MILEVAVLNVRAGQASEFEAAFSKAQHILVSTAGYISHELHRCLEADSQYLLLVQWRTLQNHTEGFRKSPDYLEWKRLLHHFYDPFPTVYHYAKVLGSS